MSYYLLQLEATLYNCTNLQLQNGFDHPSHQYHFQLVCESCRKMMQAQVTQSITVPFPSEVLKDDSDSSFDFDEDDEDNEDKNEEEQEQKLRQKEILNKLRESSPIVHFTHSCECGTVTLVIMKLGHGSPLEIAGDIVTPKSSSTTMMAFYVRGATPINYQLGGGWQVDMVGGDRRFEGVDLSEPVVYLQEDEDEDEDEEEIARPAFILDRKPFFVLTEDLNDGDN